SLSRYGRIPLSWPPVNTNASNSSGWIFAYSIGCLNASDASISRYTRASSARDQILAEQPRQVFAGHHPHVGLRRLAIGRRENDGVACSCERAPRNGAL